MLERDPRILQRGQVDADPTVARLASHGGHRGRDRSELGPGEAVDAQPSWLTRVHASDHRFRDEEGHYSRMLASRKDRREFASLGDVRTRWPESDVDDAAVDGRDQATPI